MEHSFNIEIAKELGIIPAVILNHIHHWIQKNTANDVHFYEGRYWTYNSLSAFCEMFPYATEDQIKYAIKKLKDSGFIITGQFSQNSWDKTTWYALTENGYSLIDQGKTPPSIGENPPHRSGKNTPMTRARNSVHSSYKYNIYNKESVHTSSSLNHPKSVKEVIEEAAKRSAKISAEQAQDFIDKHSAVAQGGTWIQGNTPVRDWRHLMTSGWINNWKTENKKRKTQAAGELSEELQKLEAYVNECRSSKGLYEVKLNPGEPLVKLKDGRMWPKRYAVYMDTFRDDGTLNDYWVEAGAE